MQSYKDAWVRRGRGRPVTYLRPEFHHTPATHAGTCSIKIVLEESERALIAMNVCTDKVTREHSPWQNEGGGVCV